MLDFNKIVIAVCLLHNTDFRAARIACNNMQLPHKAGRADRSW